VDSLRFNIVPGTIEHLNDCKEAWIKSELGRVYYSSDEYLTSCLLESINQKQIYIALDESNNCLGYICIVFRGAFYEFPYCRSLAVKENYRGKGIGSALLKYYEQIGFLNFKKLFILVSDFNHRAKKLYEKMGYIQIGMVPDLFKKGIAEYIMVKFKPEDDFA